MTNSPLAGASARPLAAACAQHTVASIIAAAHDLLGHLAAGRRIDAPAIRTAMQSAFGASDASGAWDWKTAYEAVEVAQLLFMRRYGSAIHTKTTDPFERLKLVERIARLAPTQTRRSEEMETYQQFSTPLGLVWVAGFAADFRPGELVLEPSAGTGLLAVQAQLAKCRLAVNEVADVRAALLGKPPYVHMSWRRPANDQRRGYAERAALPADDRGGILLQPQAQSRPARSAADPRGHALRRDY